MNATPAPFRLAAVLTVCLAAAAACQDAAEPATQYLLKADYRVLDGRVTSDGAEYTVHKRIGRITVPLDQVLAVGDSMGELYLKLVRRVPPNDVGARQRIMVWCLANGMEAETVAEAEAILQYDPKHAIARRILRQRRQAEQAPPPRDDRPAPEPRVHFDAQEYVVTWKDGHGQQLYEQFCHVERILINGCGSAACHGVNRREDVEFALRQSAHDRHARQRGLNLRAIVAELDWQNPNDSDLLAWALQGPGHTPSGAPPMGGLRDREYMDLHRWVTGVALVHGGTKAEEIASLAAIEPPTERPRSPVGPTARGGAMLADAPPQRQPAADMPGFGAAGRGAADDAPEPAPPRTPVPSPGTSDEAGAGKPQPETKFGARRPKPKRRGTLDPSAFNNGGR